MFSIDINFYDKMLTFASGAIYTREDFYNDCLEADLMYSEDKKINNEITSIEV